MARYADKPEIAVSVDVSAPTAVVWDLVTDINLPARFSEEFQGGDWLDGDGPALGARFVRRNERKGARWETTCTVVDFVDQRRFGYSVENIDDPAATWRFEIEPTAEGCKLTMWAQMGPGPSGVRGYIRRHPDREEQIVADRLEEWRRNMEATLAGVRALAESAD